MSDKKPIEDKSFLAIPGGACLGLGVGFFFFPVGVFGYTSVFAFTRCILAGVGLGLFATALLSNGKKGN